MDELSSTFVSKILTHLSTSDADSESLLRRIVFSASQLSTSISAQIKPVENCCCFKSYGTYNLVFRIFALQRSLKTLKKEKDGVQFLP